MRQEPATTVAILTPPGRGAVAVISVEGPQAAEFVARSFRGKSKTPLAEHAVGRILYGHWGPALPEDVIVCRVHEGCVEVHCHGGDAAARRIVDDLTTAGATLETWREHIVRNETSALCAAARIALAEVTTARAAEILLDQYHGALGAALQDIVGLLDAQQPHNAAVSIAQLLSRAALGLHLTQPWRVVIAGPPNVGKSSLINALVGYQRAIVFDQPGTTRDVVTAQSALSGWPIEFSDTAGLRTSDDPLETAGIERAVAQAQRADCLLLVFDASQPDAAGRQKLLADWPAALVVHNKCDLLSSPSDSAALAVSALTGAGIDELMSQIVKHLVPVEPQAGAAVPFLSEQVAALKSAEAAIHAGNPIAACAQLLALLA